MKNKILVITMLLLSSLTNNKASAQEPSRDFFVNANVGVFKNFTAFYNSFQFDYGGKVGARIANIEGFSQIWTALAYNRTSTNPTGSISIGMSELMVQPLFMNVNGSGFYFGPQAGLSFISLGSSTTNEFTYGALAGLSIPLNECWSIAPEANLTRFSNFAESQTALKLLVGANYSF